MVISAANLFLKIPYYMSMTNKIVENNCDYSRSQAEAV
jgi:hypothetical protein